MNSEELSTYGAISTDDNLSLPFLSQLGISISFVDWREHETIDWGQFDLVVIRSTWDYQHDHESFLKALLEIEKKTNLQTPLQLVKEVVF